MVPVFYAINHTRYPVIGSFLTVGANIIIILLTIDHFQHKAIALSTSCTMFFNFLFLSTILHHKLAGYSLKYLLTGLSKVLFAAAAMGVYLIGLQYGMTAWVGQGFIQELTALLFLIVSGAALYGGLLYLLQLREFTFLVDKMIQRIRG
jgi:putative peptidoglycan lipid II flippase